MVGPDYTTPEIPTPDYWNAQVREGLHTSKPDIVEWWRRFDDPTLNKLVTTAGAQNRDLAIAAERIEEARAVVGVAQSGLSPAVGAGGSITRNRASEQTPTGRIPGNPATLYEAGTSAGWELDFVGGLRRSVEAAGANLAATEEFYRDALVVVYAETASSYVDYRTLQERIDVAKSNAKNQEESVRLTKERNTAGLAPDIDVSQAETNLNSTKALIPLFRAQQAAVRNRLGVLCGKYPGTISPMLGSGNTPTPSSRAAIGIPTDLVRSRPDIRAAERQLAAQTARIGVAKAELYPKFTLSGSFALQSFEEEDFFDSRARAYGFGPGFSWRIFEGGRIRETIKIEESRTRQAYTNYEAVILEAVAEVETALSAIANEKDRLGLLNAAATSAGKTVRLVKDNYVNGLVDFQNVLDAERNLFVLQDDVAVSKGQVARNHVALYRALGGGAKMDPPEVIADKK
jgi:multidrug efflux system outer membrane protein